MSIRYLIKLFAGLVIGFTAIPGASAESYIGLGFSRLSLSSKYSSIDGRSGSGLALLGGQELAPAWYIEFSISAAGIDTGVTENIYYPADSAEYTILGFGIRKGLLPSREQGWMPWIGAGAAFHYINWNTYFYEVGGWGFFLGAGVDLEAAPSWRVRIQAARHDFSASDTYDYGPYSSKSRELSAAVIYVFR